MRIAIDLQGAQTLVGKTENIDGYTMELIQAILRNRGNHEIFLVLNGLLPESILALRTAFADQLPQQNILVWYAPGPIALADTPNTLRRQIAKLIKDGLIASINPDVIHLTSVFEGYRENAVTGIDRFNQNCPVTVSLHNSDILAIKELRSSPSANKAKKSFLNEAISQLKKVDRLFSGAGYTVDEHGFPLWLSAENTAILRKKNWLKIAETPSPVYLPTINDLGRSLIQAWEQLSNRAEATDAITSQKPRMAFVSPLPPEKSGIADYSADLLPALSEYYQIDLIVAQESVEIPQQDRYGIIRDVPWFFENKTQFDRVIYQVGNSHFHQHMVDMIKEVPGIVVLHDFFLFDLKNWRDQIGGHSGDLLDSLYKSHGYQAVSDYHHHFATARWHYPVNHDFLEAATGVIVHSSYNIGLANQWYGKASTKKFTQIPLVRTVCEQPAKKLARKHLGIDDNTFVICSFGHLGETKLNHLLIDAWLDSALAKEKDSFLVFVGQLGEDHYSLALKASIKNSSAREKIKITGFVSSESYQDYLNAADLAVQLRTKSRGESSAAVLDCMNHGLPVIANANGTMAELDSSAVLLLPDEVSSQQVKEAINHLWSNPGQLRQMSEKSRQLIKEHHSPAHCAQRYYQAIESVYRQQRFEEQDLIAAIAEHGDSIDNPSTLTSLATDLEKTFTGQSLGATLYLDVTITTRNDDKTGIQRVVRAIMLQLLANPPAGYRIEPVCLSDEAGPWKYRTVPEFTLAALNCPAELIQPHWVQPAEGDVVLVLDFTSGLLIKGVTTGFYPDLRHRGVQVFSVVYDVLPITLPEVFPPDAHENHKNWARAVATLDGAICISATVATELRQFLAAEKLDNQPRPFRVSSFHLGADIDVSAPSTGLPDNADQVLQTLKSKPTFLMVGTIEPRKGYLQVISAFTALWDEGQDINLVIVGREGWASLPDDQRRNIPETVACLRHHPRLDQNLFWMNDSSDEYLEKIYATSTCLIAASLDEGFGLPLIEAAQHGLSIIARDTPIFREVAGEHVMFFSGTDALPLAQAVESWLASYDTGKTPDSSNIKWLTWKESAAQLLDALNLE